MTTRELPVAEWWKLNGTELQAIWPHLDERNASVIVVEEGQQIIGCWAVLQVAHVEGVWIHPDYRGQVGVSRRLWNGVRTVLARLGQRTAVTAACSDDIRTLLTRTRAQVLPGEHYVLTMTKGSVPCPRL